MTSSLLTEYINLLIKKETASLLGENHNTRKFSIENNPDMAGRKDPRNFKMVGDFVYDPPVKLESSEDVNGAYSETTIDSAQIVISFNYPKISGTDPLLKSLSTGVWHKDARCGGLMEIKGKRSYVGSDNTITRAGNPMSLINVSFYYNPITDQLHIFEPMSTMEVLFGTKTPLMLEFLIQGNIREAADHFRKEALARLEQK